VTDKKIQERRDHVEKLSLVLGMSAHVVAELLGCHVRTVHEDIKWLRRRWVAQAAVVSDVALKAYEEVEILRSIGRDALQDASHALNAKEKVQFYEVAIKSFLAAGRLKQGLDK
jgi:uncharacterized protein YjcR